MSSAALERRGGRGIAGGGRDRSGEFRATATAATALDEMVEAERAFARVAAERTVRDAFLAFLADDAIAVAPYGNAKEQWQARPAPNANAPRARLEWAPRTGDVAEAGDLGWLTGDFKFIPAQGAPRHGCYFSVWERQQNGSWRVRLDVGVDTPGPVEFPVPGFVRVTEKTGRLADGAKSATAARTLVEADRALAADASAKGFAAAFLDRSGGETRLHRAGAFPLVGKTAIAKQFSAAPPPAIRLEPAMQSRVAASGDLGWTLGRYAPASSPGESGYYVRVWKRDGTGRWLVAADIFQSSAQ